MKYSKPKDNEWIRPVRRGYRMACCDCGLVHEIDFGIIKYGRGRMNLQQFIDQERVTHAN